MSIEGKSRIIQAAKSVISRSGIAGATMRGIAEEAGLSTGAIYHYYSSKEEILYEVMDESLSETLRIAEESKSLERSLNELIEEIFEKDGNAAILMKSKREIQTRQSLSSLKRMLLYARIAKDIYKERNYK